MLYNSGGDLILPRRPNIFGRAPEFDTFAPGYSFRSGGYLNNPCNEIKKMIVKKHNIEKNKMNKTGIYRSE